MPDSAAAERLRAALLSVGGGYLRNPIRWRGVTCAGCTTPVNGYQLCLRCKGHRTHSGLADNVAFLTYAVARGSEVALSAAVNVQRPRDINPEHFTTTARLPPRSHVMLIDDTWASGGHAQSAVLALRKAGADKVSVLVVARWLNQDFADNKEFVRHLDERDYDPAICPWTDGACP